MYIRTIILAFTLLTSSISSANDGPSGMELLEAFNSNDVISIQLNSHSLEKYPTFGKVSFNYRHGDLVGKVKVSSLDIRESHYISQEESSYYTLNFSHDLSVLKLRKSLQKFIDRFGYSPNPEILKVVVSYRNAFPEDEQPFVNREFTLKELVEKMEETTGLRQSVYTDKKVVFSDSQRNKVSINSISKYLFIGSAR